MYRFFVYEKEDNLFILSSEVLNHIKVLRLSQKSFLCNYNSIFYECKLLDNKYAQIINTLDINNEFKNNLILAMSVIDLKHFEISLQKAAELGVKLFIPMISKNCEYDKKFVIKKLERWQKISLNACEQSFRNTIMNVSEPKLFEEIIKIKIANKYIAHEKNRYTFNSENFYETESLFCIGPEGGFTDEEISKSQKEQFKIISLGKTILRAETAAIVALSQVKENN